MSVPFFRVLFPGLEGYLSPGRGSIMPRFNGLWRHHDFLSFWLSHDLSLLSLQVDRLALPLVAILTLNASASQLGLLAGVGSLPWLVFGLVAGSGLVGAVVTSRLGERYGPGPTIIGGSVLRALGLAMIPLAVTAGPFAVPMLIASRFVNAFGWTIWQVHQETTQQLVTPDGLRGRVTGSSLFLVRSLEAGGGFAAALLASQLGIVPIIAIGAVGALISSVWLITSPIPRLRTQPAPPWLPDSS